jgi:hypothetical protein
MEEAFLNKCIWEGDCLIWKGNKYLNGYGQLNKLWGTTYAHQWACHYWKGSPLPVGEGMCIKHSCDNRLCVNPDHLSHGTLQENIKEMVERNPLAMGRKPPTESELSLLKEMLEKKTSLREMARNLKHDRDWVRRIIRDYC